MLFNQEHPVQLSRSTDNTVSMELEEVLQVSFVSEIIWIIFFNLYYLMPQLKHGLHLVQWKKMNSK